MILKQESGSTLIIVSVLLIVVGIFSFNINRQSIQTSRLQKKTNIKRDRQQVERFIRIVLSNPDLCTKLVKIDTNNQVRINKFEFESGRVQAYKFQIMNPRYIFAKMKLGAFTYETRCPGMERQKSACVSPGSIPLLYQTDKDGNFLQCQYGGDQNHCDSLGGVWVESSKTCDLCLGMGGYWKDGFCKF